MRLTVLGVALLASASAVGEGYITSVRLPDGTTKTFQDAGARQEIQDIKSDLDPLLFAQYYPEGNVKSAAEFTPGIKYGSFDVTNCTVSVLPFCNTGTATNDNSDLVGRVVIPPYVVKDGVRYSVTSVAQGVGNPSANSGLTEIIAPSTVVGISGNAVRKCTGLVSISFPGKVSVGSGAFYGCASLSEVSLPLAHTMDGYVFDGGCKALTKVAFPSCTTISGGNVFKDCQALEEVYLPAFTNKIGGSCFNGCGKLGVVDFGVVQRGSIPTLDNMNAFSGVPKSCVIVVPDTNYVAWTTANRWRDLVTNGYRFLKHSEWEYARKYETVPTSRTVNDKPLSSDVMLTGADIAVSGTNDTKISAALAGKASTADATLTDANTWTFEPATYNGYPIEMHEVEKFPSTSPGVYFFIPYANGEEIGIAYYDTISYATSLRLQWFGPTGDSPSSAIPLTVTRAALQGYQLGNDDQHILASEAEVEALRQDKANEVTPEIQPPYLPPEVFPIVVANKFLPDTPIFVCNSLEDLKIVHPGSNWAYDCGDPADDFGLFGFDESGKFEYITIQYSVKFNGREGEPDVFPTLVIAPEGGKVIRSAEFSAKMEKKMAASATGQDIPIDNEPDSLTIEQAVFSKADKISVAKTPVYNGVNHAFLSATNLVVGEDFTTVTTEALHRWTMPRKGIVYIRLTSYPDISKVRIGVNVAASAEDVDDAHCVTSLLNLKNETSVVVPLFLNAGDEVCVSVFANPLQYVLFSCFYTD